jgi:hypothetical protein
MILLPPLLYSRAGAVNYSNKHAHRDDKRIIAAIIIVTETAFSLK